MSSLLSAEISATCNAIGYFDETKNKYYADSNTLETVKDLIRYLRRDDEDHTIRRQLGESKVLVTDLLPLLKNYHEENDLFEILLRLIMNLTTPPLLLFNFEIPADKMVRNCYLELEDHLKSYKEAFVDEGVWAVFSTHISKILDVENAERGDENSVQIERVLVLIRNVLFVPADSVEKRPDNDASLHDQVLWALHHSGLLDIILYITTNPTEQSYYMYILEIMFFMLKGQQPAELANAALQRSQGEKVRDEAELVNIRHTELNEKQKKMKMYLGARHSRFGGTYVVKSMKSISESELISHKPLNKLDSLNFDANKKKKKTPKNRTPLTNNVVDRRSAFTIRLFLKEFCIEFLNGAYNATLKYVKGVLARSDGDNHDESYYFWALRFFMAFNRLYKFEVKLISETLSVQTFYFVQQQSEKYLDLMKTDKKKVIIWSARLHSALLTYKELLMTLFVMDKSTDKVVQDSSKVIKSNIFYIVEYREFILTLLIMYDELKMTDVYLKDLMETQHLFLKMFENYCKSEGSVLVKKKSAKKRKSKRSRPATQLDLGAMWDKASPQLSAILESGGDFLTDVPFDAASDIPIDEQKSIAMQKIQYKLRHSEYESAVGVMRAAREVWPENNSFGNDNMTSEEEFLSLREIFLVDLGENTIDNSNPSDKEDSEDEEEYDEPSRDIEVEFDFKDFLHRLPNRKIARTCALALKSFKTNSVNVNHSILKLMHRIAFDCKCYVMMFELSLFRTFQQIFAVKDLPQYRELVKFAIYIIRQFLKVTQTNDKVFVELLFWTNKEESYEIEYGYGTAEKSSALSKLWSEEEENEVRILFQEHREKEIQEDVVDWIQSNLINHKRSRRMVLKKLKELDLVVANYKRGKYKPANAVYWTEEEETQLRALYSEFKESFDPLGSIVSGLSIHRPKKRVIDKLLLLGLIQYRNELKKKRHTSRRARKNTTDSNSGTGSDSESDEPSASNRIPIKNVNCQKKRTIYPNTADKTAVLKLLVENLNSGREEAIKWLKESIFDVTEDFEEIDEGVPLVPIGDSIETALENKIFRKLLTALGFAEPSDEQESYWRIPYVMSLSTLTSYYNWMVSALENNVSEKGVSQENSPPSSSQITDTATGDTSIKNTILDEKLRSSRNDPVTDSMETDLTNDDDADISDVENDTEDDNVAMKRNRSTSESGIPPVKRTRTD